MGVDRHGNTTKPRACDGASFGTGPRFTEVVGLHRDSQLYTKRSSALDRITLPANGGMGALGKQSLSKARSDTGVSFARGTGASYARMHLPLDRLQEAGPGNDAMPAKIVYPMRGSASKDTYGKAQSRADGHALSSTRL